MATYYVDATLGSDANSGLSTQLPWRTLAKVNAATFAADDFVLLKKGETWRETLTYPSSGTSGHPITFSTYGSGAAPVITGADRLVGFVSAGSDIWDVALTTQTYSVVIGSTAPESMSASKAACTAAGDWFWAANLLSVYSTSDPSGSVEAAQRVDPVNTNNTSYVTCDGITIRSGNLPYGNAGGIKLGWTSVIGIVFQNCTVENCAGIGIDIHATTATSFTISYCTVKNNGGFGIWVNNDFTAGTIHGCSITRNGWDSAARSQQFSGIQGQLGNITISGNTIYENILGTANSNSGSHGIYVLASTVVADIRDNVVYGHPNGSGIKLIGSANCYRNRIYGNWGSGIQLGQNGATNTVYVVSYNLIYSNNVLNAENGITEQTKGAGTLSLTILNNTIWKNGLTSQQEIKINESCTVLTIKNNLIVATDTRRTVVFIVLQAGTVSIDNNLHWRADGNPAIRVNSVDLTWAQWKLLGYDAAGVNADPLLSSAAAGDFRLLATSPARGAGTAVSLTTDLAGNSVGSPPDIGALEAQTESAGVITKFFAFTGNRLPMKRG